MVPTFIKRMEPFFTLRNKLPLQIIQIILIIAVISLSGARLLLPNRPPGRSTTMGLGMVSQFYSLRRAMSNCTRVPNLWSSFLTKSFPNMPTDSDAGEAARLISSSMLWKLSSGPLLLSWWSAETRMSVLEQAVPLAGLYLYWLAFLGMVFFQFYALFWRPRVASFEKR